MKITKLHIEGFRSLRDVTWLPGDLNVVIGPNGSGKSNLLAFLEMMAMSAQGGLSKHIQSSGGMDSLVWDGRVNSIRCDMDVISERAFGKSVRYTLEFQRIGYTASYEVSTEKLLIPQENFDVLFIDRNGLKNNFVDGVDETSSVPGDEVIGEESLLAFSRHLMTPNTHFFQRELSSIAIYRALNTQTDALIRRSSITRMEQRVAPDGQNLISVLHTLYTGNRDFKNDINAAMRTAFGDDFDELVFPPAADQRIQLRVRWKSLRREQSAADLSDGTLRFLYLLAILASPNPAPVIAIDEPETGLHPSMLPVIAEFAIDAATRSQVILTTHSPQMLDAFGATRPTTTVAQWHDGETTLRTIKDADLDYWLREYTLGSLFKSGELEQMA